MIPSSSGRRGGSGYIPPGSNKYPYSDDPDSDINNPDEAHSQPFGALGNENMNTGRFRIRDIEEERPIPQGKSGIWHKGKFYEYTRSVEVTPRTPEEEAAFQERLALWIEEQERKEREEIEWANRPSFQDPYNDVLGWSEYDETHQAAMYEMQANKPGKVYRPTLMERLISWITGEE